MLSKKASFLIAMPALKESVFEGSVVLLAEHNAEGALGFVINYNTGTELTENLRQLHLESASGEALPLLLGGPVETGFFWLLHEPILETESTIVIHPELYLSPASEILLITDPQQKPLIYHAGIGYAGWAANQLEREIEEGVWWKADFGVDLVLKVPIQERYQQAFESLGIHLDQLVDKTVIRNPVIN